MRKFAVLLFLVVVLAGGLIYWRVSSLAPVEQEPVASDSIETSEPDQDTTIRIAAVGDMLPHDTVNLRAETTDGYDYAQFMGQVTSQLSSGDITYCNQESPSAGDALGVSGYPTFNAPTEFSRDLEAAGCNLINLANNHVADKGQQGIDQTIDTWQGLGPLAVGGVNKKAQPPEPAYFEIEGKKFAFIAFTDLSNNQLSNGSVNMFSEELVVSLASEASANADFVIASAHWGDEDAAAVNKSQEQWAQLLVDNGADLILGAGPHVLQPVDIISASDGREVPVWYSLGNFLSTQLTIEQLVGGIALIELDTSGEGISVSRLGFMPTYMHYSWTQEQADNEDLLARDNLMLYPLDQSSEALSSSFFSTSVDEQMARVTDLINSNVEVEIVSSDQF